MRFHSLVLAFIPLVFASQNITIDDTDPSIIYSDGGHTIPCEMDSSGQIIAGQAGCFNNGPQNCTSGAHILQAQTSTLSMLFKGSAIYMNALLDDISNTYTVTLDGSSTDLDGVRPGGALLCYTLFSQTDLDPTVEHNISLSIKGLSVDRNTTLGNDDTFFFWLDNFIVTTDTDSTSASSSATGSVSGSDPTGSTSTGPSSSSSAPPSAGSSGAVSRSATSLPCLSFAISSALLLVLF